MSAKNLRYRRDYLRQTVSRFERAVENYAFKGTIPWDSEAACAAHAEIEQEYKSSKQALFTVLDNLNMFDPPKRRSAPNSV